MSTVSPTQIASGAAITSSGVNTPINQLANTVNGNLDDSNISALSGTKISAGTIPVAAMATPANPETRENESQFDFVASGLVWSGDSYGTTRNASMTAGVVYVGGRRATVSAVTARAFTASKDTYVDVDNAGVLTYTEVANNAASPALAAGNVRIAIIITGASNIAAVGSVNQGQNDKVLPIAASLPYAVTDSLGNLICPRDPQRRTLGYRQITSNFSPGTIAETVITGLTIPVIIPTGRRIKVMGYTSSASNSTDVVLMLIRNGTTTAGTLMTQYNGKATNVALSPTGYSSSYSGSQNFVASIQSTATNPIVGASSTQPAFIVVELV